MQMVGTVLAKRSPVMNYSNAIIGTVLRKLIFSGSLFARLRLVTSTAAIFLFATNAWAAGKGGGGKDPLPTAPANLIASAISSNQVVLQWQDTSTNESGFKVERAPTASGAWKQIATTAANATSYANAALTPSTTYFYRVRAYSARGNSGYTEVASATTPAATAVPCNYTISASPSPFTGGRTTGGGTVNCSSVVTLNAVASSGYNFVDWKENGVTVGSLPNYSFTATANRSLVATFAAVSCTYAITTSTSLSGGGSTTGGGTFNCGSSVTVSANASAGYSFANWTENGVVVSTAANYSFTAGSDRSLVANFTGVPCTYAIGTSVSGGDGSMLAEASPIATPGMMVRIGIKSPNSGAGERFCR